MRSPRSSYPAGQSTASTISPRPCSIPVMRSSSPLPTGCPIPDQVLLNDAVPVIVETTEEEGFKLSAKKLEQAITRKTKALILNSPSNPTGLAYDRKTLEEIAALAVKHNHLCDLRRDLRKADLRRIHARQHRVAGRGDQRPDDRGERRVKVACHDRLAHRLCRGPQGRDHGHDEHPEPEHVQPGVHFAEGGGRGAPRAPGFYPDHERRVRQEKKIHGGAPEQDEGGLLPDARRRFLRISARFVALREKRERQGRSRTRRTLPPICSRTRTLRSCRATPSAPTPTSGSPMRHPWRTSRRALTA